MSRRDLHWAVKSETPLLPSQDYHLTRDTHIGEVPSLGRPYSRRLGKYFEDLIEQWLRGRPDVTDVHRSVQVFDADRTLGEFDFLFLRDGKPIHWEVAVKFYLQMPDGLFWGPNFSDRLDVKLGHLIGHQLRLSENALALAQVPPPFQNGVTPELLFKGQFFYPWDEPRTPSDDINPHHEWGYWIPFGTPKCDAFFKERRHLAFQIIPKMRWLSPIETSSTDLLLPASLLQKTLTSHFTLSNTSLLIAALTKKEGQWTEQERFFVVSL